MEVLSEMRLGVSRSCGAGNGNVIVLEGSARDEDEIVVDDGGVVVRVGGGGSIHRDWGG
jgi:hypothetical protein